MKRMSFYAKTNRSGNLLHIETDGCIVNIRVGLHDAEGREVTSVQVIPDQTTDATWVQDGARVIRLHEGEDDNALADAHTAFGEPLPGTPDN
jgi:hypothetical protein